MANPSLKEKIEAAKSALQEGQNNTPLDQERDDLIASETILSPTPVSETTTKGVAEAPTNFEPDARTLDARITRLESKLAENRRDLYTLLGKVREVTRLQNDTAKNNGPINTRPEDTRSSEQSANGHQSRKIAITLAVLMGIILGTSVFLASDFINKHLVHLYTWAIPFADFITDIVR